jgi:hypothetical protein
MDFIKAAESANHCQRNWDEQSVSPDQVELLTKVAINMPTKQNQEFYKLIVSTDVEYNHFVYLNGYDENDPRVMEYPFEDRHMTNKNTQLRAPLLFQWIVNEAEFSSAASNNEKELYNGVGHLSVGISAGAVSLAANAMGLKTGFCVCVHRQNIIEKILEKCGIEVSGTFLTLGIGYPRDDLPHNFCVRPDNKLSMQQIYHKNIEVFRI